MNKLIIIWLFSIMAISLTAQKGLDPQRLKTLEGLIELEIPTESRSWFTDRARVDDYEITFSKDTFRVERLRCLLLNDIFDDLDKRQADTTQNKSDDGKIVQEESKITQIIAVHDEISKRYDQLIAKYVGLTEAKYPPKLKQKMTQSQNAWLTYRAHIMGLFDATQYAVRPYKKACGL